MWLIKILTKIIFSRLPLSYNAWRQFGLFKHGSMSDEKYVEKIFNLHVIKTFSESLPSGCGLLEIGPGDSIASAILGATYGASRIFLIDVGDFATRDVDFYKNMSLCLSTKGLSPPNLDNAKSIDDILECCNAEYLTDGVDSIKSLDSRSIDFIWSHSVLEHIRKKDFLTYIKEFRRVLKPTGSMSHNVDLQDHLDHGLNSLRFSEKIWEGELFVKSGFYTNRIRYSEMLKIFQDGGGLGYSF